MHTYFCRIRDIVLSNELQGFVPVSNIWCTSVSVLTFPLGVCTVSGKERCRFQRGSVTDFIFNSTILLLGAALTALQ